MSGVQPLEPRGVAGGTLRQIGKVAPAKAFDERQSFRGARYAENLRDRLTIPLCGFDSLDEENRQIAVENDDRFECT